MSRSGSLGLPTTNENSGMIPNWRVRCAMVSVCSVVIPFCISLSAQSDPDSAPKKIMVQPARLIAAMVVIGVARHDIDARLTPPAKLQRSNQVPSIRSA